MKKWQFVRQTVPAGLVKFLSPEWRVDYRFALDEAQRLGLEAGVNFCGGWCMGGPWIKPENAGRWFLLSDLTVTGACVQTTANKTP